MAKFKLDSKNSMIGGVCAGLEDYTGIDVTIWRIIFLLGMLLTTFPFFLIYNYIVDCITNKII
jgi:phage shock protein C